jgi:DNA repair protein RecO (recombination protein O)
MTESATGIILRTRPLTESSLIVQWLTPELGRIATVAKGARKPKSTFRGKLDLFYLADFNFVRSRRSELHTLREVSLRETHADLRRDLGFLQQASYCAALVEQATETETPLPVVYEMMREFLGILPRQPCLPQILLAFELKLLLELGLDPNWAEIRLNTGTREIAKAWIQSSWENQLRFKPSEAQIAELGKFLHGFLVFHLGRIPSGRAAALDA